MYTYRLRIEIDRVNRHYVNLNESEFVLASFASDLEDELSVLRDEVAKLKEKNNQLMNDINAQVAKYKRQKEKYEAEYGAPMGWGPAEVNDNG